MLQQLCASAPSAVDNPYILFDKPRLDVPEASPYVGPRKLVGEAQGYTVFVLTGYCSVTAVVVSTVLCTTIVAVVVTVMLTTSVTVVTLGSSIVSLTVVVGVLQVGVGRQEQAEETREALHSDGTKVGNGPTVLEVAV